MSILDTALLASAMVVALVSGLYAGLGLRAEDRLDRGAELVFAASMWALALAGAHAGGNWGLGLVNGTQVLLVAWSVLHLPQLRTLETPVPRLFPASALVVCVVSIVLLGAAVAIAGTG